MFDQNWFYAALYVHLISLVTGFGSVIVIDFSGIAWLRGKLALSQLKRITGITQPLIWLGWAGLVISGTVLLISKGFIDNLTWIKLFLVAMLGVNGIYLHLIKKDIGRIKDGASFPGRLKFRIGLASAVSQLGWWGALTIGFLHRQVQGYFSWPDSPLPIIGLIILAILIAAGSGRMLTKNG